MSNLISELHILDEVGNIFDAGIKYSIPLYQRAYAWKDKELMQLVEDISDVREDANYYIGSLIVYKTDKYYEVVDGQQRLTSLFLLLNCLGIATKETLTFACREKSNFALKHIRSIIDDDLGGLDSDSIEPGIWQGIKILKEELQRADIDKDDLIRKLKKVIVYRIEVPENTDLNRYFEIMNTRGEQLEQHDILKAMLMGYLQEDPVSQEVFAKIWDPCSDMNGYVQMHFISKWNVVRENVFSGDWNELPTDNWDKYITDIASEGNTGVGHKITDIIGNDYVENEEDGYNDDDVRVRFESIIKFPFFLIHTLKVFIAINGITHEDGSSAIVPELMDDKKLIDIYRYVIDHGVMDGKKISEDKALFAKRFVMCLLRTRYLFDKYIVKTEYANDNVDGKWSIKTLRVSGQRGSKKPYYKNSPFTRKGEWDTTNEWRAKHNVMIQSALRVSYTSPKVMHWITKLLIWMSEDDCIRTKNGDMALLYEYAESIAQAAVKENFFDVCGDGAFGMGVNAPNIVFNYLDYLLWKREPSKYSDFEFEFRNSVEHWYPQHPSEGTFEPWKDGVDQFGNLCIIQRNINSKFSNMSPEAKKSTFPKMIANGSIKLRLMSELTEANDGLCASYYWRKVAYKRHEQEMLKILMDACGVDSLVVFPDEEDVSGEDLGRGVTFDVSKVMLDWAKEKASDGEFTLALNKCGKKYVRFTTSLVSELLPDNENADSRWKTRNQYFYEIVNLQNSRIYMKLTVSGVALTPEQRLMCDRIESVFPSSNKEKNWQKWTVFSTDRIKLTDKDSKETVRGYLDDLYESLMSCQAELVSKVNSN